jgi:dihydrofolate reductase
MIKSIIAAKSDNDVIGKDNDLVWHMPADLKFFKNTTKGHWVIMGRKTFESMNGPLPHRTHIIITRNPDYRAEGCYVVSSVDEAFEKAAGQDLDKVFILGGAEIYRQTMDKADQMYITEIKSTFEGDSFFPPIDPAYWEEVSREEYPADAKNPYPYAFVAYRRR